MSTNRPPRARKRKLARAASVSTVTAVALGLSAGTAGATLTATSTAGNLASAIAGAGANVTGASFVALPPSGTPHAVADSGTSLGSFPTAGSNYAILTSGDANLADDANVSSGSGANIGGPSVRGNSDFDVSILKIDLDVPQTANCLRFDFRFLSDEYPEYVGSSFNDAFIAELDSSTWTTSGSSISAPNNFAFDPAGNPVTINSSGATSMSPAESAGTTYDGATPLLSAAKQVTPGAHSLYLSIFDQGDHILDSAAFVDNLVVGFVPDPANQCKAGAQPKNYDITLTPPSATKNVGDSHTVTATVSDASDWTPVSGGKVLFTASGANTASGDDTTDSSGAAEFMYTGTAAGNDGISACYDVDNSNTCDAGEPVASATAEWQQLNQPPTAGAGGPYAGDEGSSIGIVGTAGDPDGDPVTTTWSIAPDSGTDPGASCTIADPGALNTSVHCDDDGVYKVTLTADDGNGATAQSDALVTVGNVAPSVTITSPASGGVYPIGNVSVGSSFTDPGSNDTHVCEVDWDNGAGFVAGTPGSGTCGGTNSYAAAGVYTVSVKVADDDGGSDTAEVLIVVYDPSAGFVTGGGWINSPEGAYPADPDLSGKANFGFVSKYKKGVTTPTGETEFQFHAGALNFHSESYQWLVVSGAKAQYKGYGAINGETGYGFLLTATDGQVAGGGGVDKFRIKIWKTSDSSVVYDNAIGSSDDLNSANPQAIGGGSIVIHK